MKKLLLISFLAFSLLSLSAQAISVNFNGEALSFDSAPVNENGRVLVPMRAIFEKFGAQVNWDASTGTAIAVSGDKIVLIQAGNPNAFVNSDVFPLDVPAKIINDRTMVPVRFISEALGADVTWDGETETVNITLNK